MSSHTPQPPTLVASQSPAVYRIHPWLPTIAAVLGTLFLSISAHAQIEIGGIYDTGRYNNQAAFTVVTNAAFDYTAMLDAQPTPVGVSTSVAEVDYHELSIWATNRTSGVVTNYLCRFVVLAPERGGTETGLPRWVPYPPIPSSADEMEGAHIRLIIPSSFPAGLRLPVVAWVENEAGNPVRVNGSLVASDGQQFRILRGVGSGLLTTSDSPTNFTYTAHLQNLVASNAVSLDSQPWQEVSGNLTGETTWPDNSRISVVGKITVPAGSKLTIGSGSVIKLAPGVDIALVGTVEINGSTTAPVVFTPVSPDQPWGGFFLTNSTSKLVANGTIFTGSGANPNGTPQSHRHEQSLFFLSNHAQVALTNCAAIYLAGQLGHAVDGGAPLNKVSIVRTLIQRLPTGGEWNGSEIQMLQSALIECPYVTPEFADQDEDGIYFTTGKYEVRDSLIGWTRDDGIDSGSGGAGSVLVTNTWIEATYHEAFAWSGGDRITTNLHTVCINCGQGIECGWSTSDISPDDFVNDSLSAANGVGARFGDNYDWNYTGFLRITNSFLLYNHRDVFGVDWSDWQYHTERMDIQGNLLSAPNPRHPNNGLWDPATDGPKLAPFMTTPAAAPVGIGFGTWSSQLAQDARTSSIPVRLSSFTTQPVKIDYQLSTAQGVSTAGTLTFAPGETIKFITGLSLPGATPELARLELRNPDHARITGESNLWFVSSATEQNATLVPQGAIWKYLDLGSNAPAGWNQIDFDDSGWKSGAAELGYGDSKDGRPETTVISYGPDANNKYITSYFRHAFTVTDPGQYGGLTFTLKRDDGAVVYLNGKEVFRSNLEPGTVDYSTLADNAGDDGADFSSYPADGTFQAGTNVVAVEVHQDSRTSSDLSFDLGLQAAPAAKLAALRFGKDWVLMWNDPAAQLEAAESLLGPWSAFSNSSPTPIDTGAGQRFFRIRKQP